MIQIGITGGIGSGKSTICQIIETLGYPVYYSDIRGKYLTSNTLDILQKIRHHFGDDVFDEFILNRSKLGKVAFSDPEKLKLLNSIIHPYIEQDYKTWVAEQTSPLIFKEAAIMFESGLYKELEFVICVVAPEELRIKRVMERNKLTREEVINRISQQWTDKEKLALSEAVIYADDKQFVIPQISAIINRLKKRF